MPPLLDPLTINVAEPQLPLNAVPFAPLRIVTTSGQAYAVSTPEHLTIMRLSRRVVVEDDDLSGAYISPLHIAAIEPYAPAAGK